MYPRFIIILTCATGSVAVGMSRTTIFPSACIIGPENGTPEASWTGCLDLAQVLERMKLRVPAETRIEWKASRPKKVAMTFAQAESIVDAGIAKGTRRHRSVAIGVAAQFEFTLRQIDVIGSWSRINRARAVPDGAIMCHGKFWRGRLRYEDLATGVLDLSTSKTGSDAVFDATAYPLFLKAMRSIPEAERTGPLTVDESGVPFQRRYYVKLYGELAAAAGVPRTVWNMRARHGGVSEAVDAGVSNLDLGKHAQHSSIQTTFRHYVVPTIETSRRVAKARVAHRQKKESA
jgi:hypothetical protein